MRKKLLLTVAVLSVLGIHSSAQALSFEDAKRIFDTPVPTTTDAADEPISDLEAEDNSPSNQAPGDESEKLRGESEPNNSAESADPLESDVEYIGQIFGPEDQDWFRIDTTQNNEILTIKTAVANELWLFTVRDRAGNILASAVNNDSDGVISSNDGGAVEGSATNNGTDQFKLTITVEKAGTYYVIVSPAPDTFGLQGDNTFTEFSTQTYHMVVTLSDPTNADNPIVDSNFNDLETEPNNGRDRADPLASGKILFGQLFDGGDEDWFEIQSPGNEIIDINFCGPLTPCAGQTSRIVMVLKKEFIDTAVERALNNRPLVYAPGLPGPAGTLSRPYIEYLGQQGLLGDALIGKIHPDFGTQNHLQIGIDEPGTYYFVVAGKLARNDNGVIDTNVTTETIQVPCANFSPPCATEFTEETVVSEGPFVVFADFDDDQYAISIRRTNLAPHTPGTNEFTAERARASFDSSTNIIHIPELEFNGAVFEAELIHRNDDERNIYELLQLRELAQ
jgi:hypothetical protein